MSFLLHISDVHSNHNIYHTILQELQQSYTPLKIPILQVVPQSDSKTAGEAITVVVMRKAQSRE